MYHKFCMIAVAGTVGITPPAFGQTISMGTNPQGSVGFAAGSAVSAVGVEYAGLRMRAVPQGGPNAVLPQVNSGELDFTVVNGTVANFAYNGVEEFSSPNQNLRFVANLFPLYAGFIVRGNSDIHELLDLRGRSVPTTYVSQMTLVNSSVAVLATVGLGLDDLNGTAVPNGVRGLQDLVAGSVDATWFSATSGQVREADASIDGGIRVLAVADTAENDAIVAQHAPGSTITTIQPGPNFPGVSEPIGSFTQPFVLVAGAHVPDDVVEALLSALHDNQPALVASFPSFAEFAPDAMNLDIGIPVHPGALRYFQSLGQ